MSLTREAVCRHRDCPHPRSPEFHECWCGALATAHHHVEHKGMGGSKARSAPENVIALCLTHHEAVHTGGYKDAFEDGYYVVRNRKGQRVVRVAL